MHWLIQRPAEGQWMPWRNGGGSTLELAIEPPDATLETGFHWRLSSAQVATSGPFSRFPGLERWLLLLDGDGFHIDFGDRGSVELTHALQPLRFSGDWPAEATLRGGPSSDLNLMVDPRVCRAQVEVHHLTRPHTLLCSAPTTLVLVVRGTLFVPCAEAHLGQLHLLRVEQGQGAWDLVPGYGGVSIVEVAIRPLEPLSAT